MKWSSSEPQETIFFFARGCADTMTGVWSCCDLCRLVSGTRPTSFRENVRMLWASVRRGTNVLSACSAQNSEGHSLHASLFSFLFKLNKIKHLWPVNKTLSLQVLLRMKDEWHQRWGTSGITVWFCSRFLPVKGNCCFCMYSWAEPPGCSRVTPELHIWDVPHVWVVLWQIRDWPADVILGFVILCWLMSFFIACFFLVWFWLFPPDHQYCSDQLLWPKSISLSSLKDQPDLSKYLKPWCQ